MENATYSNMFTEKITDCFMTGTIPIYYGISNIGDYFNTDGIIILDDNFKLDTISCHTTKLQEVKIALKDLDNQLIEVRNRLAEVKIIKETIAHS
jgi:hypothetical protein